MGQMVGADPDQLDKLGRTMAGAMPQLATVRGHVQSQVHGIAGAPRPADPIRPAGGTRRPGRRLVGPLLAAGALAGLLLSSCTSGSEANPVSSSSLPSATRSAPGPVRHDAEPLTKRFAALGEPLAVTWQSGTTGDASAPGPSTYWIDAAVRLQPAVAASLRATPGLTGTGLPDLPAAVLAAAGDGPWQTGDALDSALRSGGFGAQAYLGDDDVLVLRAVGSGDAG